MPGIPFMALHILDAMAREGFEEVIALFDRRSGLRGFLGIHDTVAGPAFGGIRRFTYRNETEALVDCLRLSRAMSHKCVLTGVEGGGGKLVILDQPELDLPSAYRHVGKVVERLGGRYYTGPDVGTGEEELAAIAEETSYVTRPDDAGPGDLPEATAAGVLAAMGAALAHLDGRERWDERTIVIQGLGAVGYELARRLIDLGARVLAAEIDSERLDVAVEELGVETLGSVSELDQACDVFAPCAMGGSLHDLSVQRLRASVVCGAANNPLAHHRHGERLHERGILYVPDVIANAGALIRGAGFHLTGKPTALEEIERRVASRTTEILELAARRSASPSAVTRDEAERLLRERRAAHGETPAAALPPVD